MSEWCDYKLGDIAEYVSRGISPKYVKNNGIPVINQKCIRGGTISLDLIKYQDKEKKHANEKIVHNEDILINSTGVGTAGRVAIFRQTGKVLADSHISILRLNRHIAHPLFVYYNLRKRETEIEGYAEGSTGQIELSRDKVKEIDILLPTIPEQKAIANVLSSLDDKIDLLHRQNKTLESMAETLFRQWFIEEAREGWEDGTIADLIDFNPLRKLSKGSVAPYLEMASLNNSTFNPDDWYDRAFSSGTKFINGDTLLARITPCLENGKTAYVTFLDKNQVCWGSTEYIVMRPKGELHPFFAYVLARNTDFRAYAEGCLAGSSGRQRVELQHLKNYVIKIPTQDIVSEFNSLSESITPKLHSNFLQIRTLEKLRDTLLPKLMSGEVRVKN